MEIKVIIIWGQGDFDKVNPKLNPDLFYFFFQDSKGGTQASHTTKHVIMGWRHG